MTEEGCARSMPCSVPTAMLWSPPSVMGIRPADASLHRTVSREPNAVLRGESLPAHDVAERLAGAADPQRTLDLPAAAAAAAAEARGYASVVSKIRMTL
jgi:hypothetical protein